MNELAIVNLPPALPATTEGADNAAIVYLKSLGSPNSRRAMRNDLEVIAEIVPLGLPFDVLPWGTLRYKHTQAIRAQLEERYSAATANHILSTLRQTLKSAWRLGQMTADEYMTAADLKSIKGEKPDQAAGRALAEGEMRAIVSACKDGTQAGARDAAIFALAYSGGLRRAELVALDIEHVDADTGVLRVRGKGNKTRTVHIHNGALRALIDWLTIRGDAPGALFWASRKGGELTPAWHRLDADTKEWVACNATDEGAVLKHMSTQAIYNIMQHRAKQAGVKAFSPHDLRRTFAGDMLDAGVDIATVQRMMGHASVSTTSGYDRRGERAKSDAAKKLHYPY